MARLKVTARPATAEDSEGLSTLLDECPMGSSIRLVMQRRPDYFAAASVQAQAPQVIVGEEAGTGRIVGSFAAGTREVFVDGKPSQVRYLSDLRIHPDHRGSTLLARGYRYLREHVFAPGEWAQTVVLDDNRAALEVLTSGRAGLPRYHPAGDYHCYMIPTGQRAKTTASDLSVRTAGSTDIAAMQAFFDREAARKAWCPVYRFSELGDGYYRDLSVEDFVLAFAGEELVGIGACWNQGAFKQTRVAGYAGALRWLRPAYNMAAAVMPSRVALPAAGTFLKSAYATATHCRDDDPAILAALLDQLVPAARIAEADYLVVGLDASSALCDALDSWSTHLVRGGLYLVGFESTPPASALPEGEFYFECARI